MDEVRWREWSDDAFAESKKSGKPVLLDISAVWCHWCHVMDDTTYSDPAVIKLINDRFIPIRVDNDRNPDINNRYNMGGWPSTAFLTHNRDVITGATYVPADQMLTILERVSSAYSVQGEDLIKKAEDAREDAQIKLDEIKPGVADIGQVNFVLEAIKSSYDPQYGGFGFDQKFPFADVLDFLLFNYEITGNKNNLEIVTNTLRGMIDGEIFDKVAGGMFRYATRRDWTVPHYEKMLGDNASISGVLLDTYRITRDEAFLDTALKVFSYLESTLKDAQTGAYFGSQDADEEYYQTDAAGRREMLEPVVDSAVFTDSNANLAMSYLKLWGETNDASAREKALGIVDYLNGLARADDGTVGHYFENGNVHLYGNLSDQACIMLANILCYESSGRVSYLDAARNFADAILHAFKMENGGLSDISSAHAAARGLSRHSAQLNENAVVAISLMMLANLTDDSSYWSSARSILDACANVYMDYGVMAASYAIAVTLLSIDPVLVTVSAKENAPEMDDFIKVVINTCGYRCNIKSNAQMEEGQVRATICVGSACRAHVSSPSELSRELDEVKQSI